MILVIGKENCNICENTKQKLDELGIKYEYKLLNELENKKDYIQIAKEHGQMAMPILFNDKQYITLQEIIDNNTLKITKRNGDLVSFDKQRVINAINNAMFETGEIDNNLSEAIAYEIETEILPSTKVEDIQDIIISKLEKYKRNDIAKRYSKYRNKKTKEREIKQTIIPQKLLSDEFLSKYKHTKPPFTPLGEFVYYRTYSRWIPELKRREYWWETVQRVVEYNCSLLPTSTQEAEELYDNIFNLRQFPSGRSLWINYSPLQ